MVRNYDGQRERDVLSSHVAKVRPRCWCYAPKHGHCILSVGKTAIDKRPSKMANGVQCGEEGGDDGHQNVKTLAVVPVDESRDRVGSPAESSKPSRHGEDQEEECRVKHLGD